MQTGQTIAELRTRANITQEQLAAQLFVSRELVSKWETGKSNPNYKMLMKIADTLSVTVDDLLDRDQALAEELASCIPPEFEIGADRLRSAVNGFLSTLSVRDRAVFIRRYYFFEDVSEIGDEYGLSDGYVRTILMRTRRKLKKHMRGVNL